MPRILIISPQVYPKPHSGVGMRGHFQAVHLSQLWPVTLVTETGIYEVREGEFSKKVDSTVPPVPNGLAFLKSLLYRTHYLYEKYNCRQWLIPNVNDYTHLIIHYPALLALVGKGTDSSIIFDTHNNEREYFETVASQISNPIKRAVVKYQARVSERLIRRVGDRVAATVSVSESDRAWVSALCAGDVAHFVVPNNLFRYAPTIWSGRRSLLFVGSLDVTMNIQALEWFVSEVWHDVRNSMPELEFIVAGRNPSAGLVAELEKEGATVVPNAPSLEAVYADALCSVIPSSSGSGGKIKVCESLAYGVPVLTTSRGLVGQPSAVRECCTIHDDPSLWVEAIRAMDSAGRRSTPEWDRRVESALDSSYFGTSIQQLAQFIGASANFGPNEAR